ncbi:MAG: FecR domain-containing protein [Spirosomataceae bacterium]
MEPYNSRSDLLKMFRNYLDGTATPEEKRLVDTLYDRSEKEPDVIDSYTEQEKQALETRMETYLKKHIQTETPTVPLTGWSRWQQHISWRNIAAASVLIACLGGGYYYYNKTNQPIPVAQISPKDLTPGGDHATLTLSDGSQIRLDNASNGMLAKQGEMTIHKVEQGLVAYSGKGLFAENQFNTITAPIGGKYSVVLPDGSRAWLNAESSIKFPTVFAQNERKVAIAGEVYFEVAPDKQKPFLVDVRGVQSIKVLGTHFNVNAYGDETAVTTTLLEGSVVVSPANTTNKTVRLKPGDQASLSGKGTIQVEKDVNTERVIAWKNGFFQFEKANIKTVMRQLSRWYNVDVTYEGPASDRTFSGKINRSVNASEVLEILQFTGVNFRIEQIADGAKKGRIVVTTP